MSFLKTLLHLFGLACIGGSALLQCLVFFDIAAQGYFAAVEPNPYILTLEWCISICGVTYFIFLEKRFLSSIGRKPS
jgi:hypothetical protein